MLRIFIVVLFLLFIDFYVFRTIKNQISGFENFAKYSIYVFYWIIPVLIIVLATIFFSQNASKSLSSRKLIFFVGAGFALFYLPKIFILSFQIFEDFSKIIAWIVRKLSDSDGYIYQKAEQFSKSFLIGKIGLIVAIIPFISVIYGISIGRFNFRVNNISLSFKHLPASFDGFKIVQFSDFHSGSLVDQQNKFKKAFEMINQQNADIIVFTGDIVNDNAKELEGWVKLLSGLNAKYGKFSILGNHDYGDYHRWESEDAKHANLERLKSYHKEMGFNLLLNKSVTIARDSQSIALLGVENWGEKPFPQHGRLDLVLEEAKSIPFKILLSHDPTHWDYEVKGKTDIALTLSGHTHGMQLAVNIGNFSWSPVSLKYPKWKGLYSEKEQFLYVNLGLGYIGFPGRIGTDPEITVFELKCK